MKAFWIGLGLGTLACAAVLTVMRGEGPTTRPDAVARGAYLVNTMGCADCHSPKRMGTRGPELDPDRFLSGSPEDSMFPAPPVLPEGPWAAVASWDLTAWSGPWGVSYAMNLTPDEGTGIGMWTEEMFVNSIRKGKKMGVGRDLLPPMPWQVYANLTDDDLKSIFAYLKSLPAIPNTVPAPVPPAAAHTASATVAAASAE